MNQTTLSDIEYSNRRRKTRRERFLDSMDALLPWDDWAGLIRPYYPAGKRGRPPRNMEMMLRMYLIRSWFQLSDKATEDAIYDSYALRKFMHLDFLKEQVPDARTLGKFRHLMGEHHLDQRIAKGIVESLEGHGYHMRAGSLVEARLVGQPAPRKSPVEEPSDESVKELS